ncbi:MAG: HEAT repeat domain-containing protein [Candidatus Zixiibacteriota bacterium]|nr:MAG: HEAT repeat domain-containing protein [candidate division Zixibacteria bacterium]
MPELDFETEFEQIDAVELDSVKKLIQLLSNSLKSVLIYPSNNPLPKEFRTKLYKGLSEFLDAHDELNLEIGPHQLLYGGKAVYQDGEKEGGMAYILHKDGVRELTFLKGLEFEEIEDLLEVMHTCFKSPDSEEDLVTLLWEKDLNHVKHLVVDDLLDVDVPSAEDVPDDWDFDRLFHSEVSFGEEGEVLPKIDHPDLSQKYREDQLKQLLKQLKEFSPEEVGSIQRALELNCRYRSLDQFLNILVEIFLTEEDLSEFGQMMDTVDRVLVTLISMADFHSASKIVQELNQFVKTIKGNGGQTDSLTNEKAQRATGVIDKAGDRENLRRMSQVINDREIMDLSSADAYLSSLHWNSIPAVVSMLRDLKTFPARRMVCEVLTEKAKDHLELLGEGISDPNWYVVRNVAKIIGTIGAEDGARLLRQIVKHRDRRVRKEVVASLIRIRGNRAGNLLVSFLDDEDKGIRILASRGLAQRKEQEALPVLENIINDDQFKYYPPEEKKSMLESFAGIAGDEGISFLVKTVRRRSWLKRDKHNETRIFAIGALSQIDSREAEEAISQLAKKRNKVVRQTCQNALRRIESRRMREGQPAGDT